MDFARRAVRSLCLYTGRCERLYLRCLGYDYALWADWLRRNRGMRIGPNTSINPKAVLMDWCLLTIGSNCSISACTFVTHSGGDRVIRNAWRRHVDSQRPIVVGDNTTIGINVTIMYGVTIGNNCVIGAGSFVSRDVPAGTVMRPPEAVCSGTTDAYVQRLAAHTETRENAPADVEVRPGRAWGFPNLPIPGWLIGVAVAFAAGALLVPSPFFD